MLIKTKVKTNEDTVDFYFNPLTILGVHQSLEYSDKCVVLTGSGPFIVDEKLVPFTQKVEYALKQAFSNEKL